MFFLHAKSLANSQILSKNRFLSANPEAFVETKKQLFFPRIQTVRKKPTNENLFLFFLFLGRGCLILGASWHLGVTNEKIWGEKTKMDERETFILGSFKTKHAHEKRWLSTSYSCAPQIRVLHHLFGSSNLCTEVIITDRCLKPSRREITKITWDISCSETSKLVSPRIQSNDKQNRKNIPAFLRNNNIASMNIKTTHNITMIATQLFWSFTKEKIKWAVQNPAYEFVQTCVNPCVSKALISRQVMALRNKTRQFCREVGEFLGGNNSATSQDLEEVTVDFTCSPCFLVINYVNTKSESFVH